MVHKMQRMALSQSLAASGSHCQQQQQQQQQHDDRSTKTEISSSGSDPSSNPAPGGPLETQHPPAPACHHPHPPPPAITSRDPDPPIFVRFRRFRCFVFRFFVTDADDSVFCVTGAFRRGVI